MSIDVDVSVRGLSKVSLKGGVPLFVRNLGGVLQRL